VYDAPIKGTTIGGDGKEAEELAAEVTDAEGPFKVRSPERGGALVESKICDKESLQVDLAEGFAAPERSRRRERGRGRGAALRHSVQLGSLLGLRDRVDFLRCCRRVIQPPEPGLPLMVASPRYYVAGGPEHHSM
jgi:hypothetical protein